jgi:hypothetical protein
MVGCVRRAGCIVAAGFVALACTSAEGSTRASKHVDGGRGALDAETPVPSVDAAPDVVDLDSALAHVHDGSIFAFTAANVYHDFPSLDMKQDSKFEIFMDPGIDPAQLDSLRVFGPHGFVFDFINEPFGNGPNGYLSNARQPVLWYQALQLTTLEAGRYTLVVTFKDGGRGVHARNLVSNFALRDFYLSHKDQMTYRPNDGTAPADGATLSWSTLHDLGGPDAYYISWISSGTAEAIDGNTARGDSIFVEALTNPQAGFNVGSSTQGSAMDPLPVGPQTWQVEIVDSNSLDGINMIVFTPGQHFVAE